MQVCKSYELLKRLYYVTKFNLNHKNVKMFEIDKTSLPFSTAGQMCQKNKSELDILIELKH